MIKDFIDCINKKHTLEIIQNNCDVRWCCKCGSLILEFEGNIVGMKKPNSFSVLESITKLEANETRNKIPDFMIPTINTSEGT